MIRWFARNGVAANLLMGIILVAGLVTASQIKMELFPEFDLDMVSVRVPYPGAAPEEVESGIVEVVEERIQDVEGIKKLTSTAAEGYGSVVAEVQRGYDATDLADKIKVRIDAIDNFPEDAEEPTVEEITLRSDVIGIALYGEASERDLKELAERVRDRLVSVPGITQVDVQGVRDYEIAINVREQDLRKYGLTFDEVARALREGSVDLPGGSVKSRGGEVLLRTTGQAYVGREFAGLTLITRPDGSRLTVGDVADVEDGFIDEYLTTTFNGEPAVVLLVFAVGEQSVLEIADKVKAFSADYQERLPEGVSMEPFRDWSYYLKGRLMMLVENGIYGLALVFVVLTLFLRPSLAVFVALGIPVSFLGAVAVIPFFDVSINLASLFGFILVLGIVVDDAIVVGESVFTHFQEKGPGIESSIAGAERVAIPVTFAVLTTVVAFIPILMMPGFIGKFFFPIPVVVMATLLWSLVQSKLVLPYHLTLCKVGDRSGRERISWLQRRQRDVADGLERFVKKVYRPSLTLALRYRYATVAGFIAVLMVTLGLVLGRRVDFVFIPPVPSDYIVATLRLPEGAPIDATRRAVSQMETALYELIDETEEKGLGDPFDNVVVTIGSTAFQGGGPGGTQSAAISSNTAEIAVELVKSEDRAGGGVEEELSAPYLAQRWRELIGAIPAAKELTFQANAAGGAGAPIDIQLTGLPFEELKAASRDIQQRLATYEGLQDIKDNYDGGKREIQLDIKTSAEALGLTQAMLGRQVRQAFYGEEAQRIQRGRDDIRVMVRYPPGERESLANLRDMRVRTPEGVEIPFAEVAEAELDQGFPTITRVDRSRVINVTADADKKVADLEAIKADLTREGGPETEPGYLEKLQAKYPGIQYTFEGESREQAESFGSLIGSTALVLFLIYALMAVPFRSYLQPLIIMTVIPFGLVGAILGHALLGHPLSMLSILGFVALAGVVVNDSLVMVDFINQERRSGTPLEQAVRQSGQRRFRPILLTSLTTFVGLTPVLLETSLQAQFLIPMAISLSFGVLFATFITLLLVPSVYLILEDILHLFRRAARALADCYGSGSGARPEPAREGA